MTNGESSTIPSPAQLCTTLPNPAQSPRPFIHSQKITNQPTHPLTTRLSNHHQLVIPSTQNPDQLHVTLQTHQYGTPPTNRPRATTRRRWPGAGAKELLQRRCVGADRAGKPERIAQCGAFRGKSIVRGIRLGGERERERERKREDGKRWEVMVSRERWKGGIKDF